MPEHFLSQSNRFARALVAVFVCFWIAILFLTPGCDQPPPEPAGEPQRATPPAPEPLSTDIRDAWNHYHIYGVDALSQPVACVNELKQQVTEFIRNTNAEALASLRTRVARCRTLYQVSRLFVPSNDKTRQAMDALHDKIGHPLEMPGFVDAVPGYPYSGIVNDATTPITRDELLRQHGLTDSSDVSLGFDVIDFLVWGAYHRNPETEPRPLEDFMAKQDWDSADYEMGLAELDVSEHPNNRRRRYLELAVMILEEHLSELATRWNKNTLPPLNMDEADRVKNRVIDAIGEQLQAPGAPENQALLNVLVPMLTPGDQAENGAAGLLTWLGLEHPEALAQLSDQEKPLTAKYSALATLFSVPDVTTSDTETDPGETPADK